MAFITFVKESLVRGQRTEDRCQTEDRKADTLKTEKLKREGGGQKAEDGKLENSEKLIR